MSGKRVWKLQDFVAHSGRVQCARLGEKSGQVLATGGDDKRVNIWKVGKPNAMMSLTGHTSAVECLVFDKQEEVLIVGCAGGSMQCWNLEYRKMAGSLAGHRNACTCVEFHPYGEFFASGSTDTNLKIWDLRRKSCIQTYPGHSAAVSSIRFSPHGRWVATGGLDNQVKIWDLTAGKKMKDLDLHKGAVTSLAFHPKEYLLVSGSVDRTVILWSLETFMSVGLSSAGMTAVQAVKFYPEDQESQDSPEAQPEANPKEAKMKIKKLKIPLEVAESFDGIHPRFLSVEEKSEARSRLLAMRDVDKEIQQTNAIKNQLESYIYESRDKITDENSLLVSSEEQRSAVMEQLQAMEDWMWEEEAQKANASLLQEKLASLEEHVRPILRRAWEMEQRALLPELIGKIQNGVNSTLDYVIKNMSWVPEKETSGVAALLENFTVWYENVSSQQQNRDLTLDPTFSAIDARRRLDHIRSEAVRLTKIKKIDPMPYNDAGRDYWKDPKMREFYEQYYKNLSRNGTNYSEWFRNFNFSNFNFSGNSNGSGDSDDYMRSFRDFYKANGSETSQENASADNAGSNPDLEQSNPEL